MPPKEEEFGVHTPASLEKLLRVLDEQMAAIELPEIRKPVGDADSSNPITALQAEIEQLCAQRAVNIRELHRTMAEAERAVRDDDDVRAKEAMTRHAEHLRLAHEAEALLTEFRALIIDVRRSLSGQTK